jgi:hypothetical protein
MRRLLPVLATLALIALAPTGAGGATPAPTLKVLDGAAHKAGDRVQGWFVIANAGTRQGRRAGGHVTVNDGGTRRVLERWTTPAPGPGERRLVRFSDPVPGALAPAEWRIDACSAGRCLRIGHFWIVRGGGGEKASPGSGEGSTKQPPPGASVPKQPISTVPTAPLAHPVAEPFFHAAGGIEYWGFVPRSYDPTNQAPTTLLVWMHGCGGEAEGDAWVVDPGSQVGVEQDWMTLSLGGRDGECWAPRVDEAKVIAALADFETHFNVDRRRVLLGGYSAGGDLAYRTGFRNSSTFAGLLIENSSPFRDTESTQAESLAAATTKFHIAHLAHTGDDIYPIAEVQAEINAAKTAGFPVELIERPGGHSDSHTDSDLLTYLLPHIDDGWLAPAP